MRLLVAAIAAAAIVPPVFAAPSCSVSTVRSSDPPTGGFTFVVSASCVQTEAEMFIGVTAVRKPDGDCVISGGGTSGYCVNTNICIATFRIACTPPGDYDVFPVLTTSDSPTTLRGESIGLSVPQAAQLNVRFEADQSGNAQPIVNYVIPQQYSPHHLIAMTSTNLSADSGTVGVSGEWRIPFSLRAGVRLQVTPSCVGDPELNDPSNGSSINVVVPQVRSPFQVVVQNLTENFAPETKQLKGAVVATVPLGTRFIVALQKNDVVPRPLSAQVTIAAATFDFALSDPSLYTQDVLLEFDANTSSETKMFQAVHLGSERVVFSPDDGSVPQQTFTVKVVRPARLGTIHNTITAGGSSYDLDEKIVTWADHRGVPPQVVKGIIEKETLPAFNPQTWRYEPLTTDYDTFSPKGNDERTDFRYSPYRMEYDNANRRGLQLVDAEDVHPRSKFFLNTACGGAKIPDSLQDVTADAIYEANDCWQNWLANLGPGSKRTAIQLDAAQELDWSAQTTLASSYGLMQVLFEESFIPSYDGINGRRRPYYLFDLPPAVNAGAGSLPVGSALLVDKFRSANGLTSLSPTFKTFTDFDDCLLKALSAYNGTRRVGAVTNYGLRAFAYSFRYLPIPNTNIFQ